MKKTCQNQRILNYLLKGNALTPLEALKKFDCLRLSARIKDLRDEGFEINTKLVKTRSKKIVGQYYIPENN